MRIQQIKASHTEMPPRPEAAIGKSEGATLFSRTFTSLSQEHYADYIRQSMAQIEKQGQELARRADLQALSTYREMVRALLEETVSSSFAFHKYHQQDARGRSKVFALVQKINQELEGMAQKLLDEQAENIELLRSVDDIRGMLVDIFM